MTSGSTWRKHPFKIGGQYLARESFDGLTSDMRTRKFQARQIYTLLHIGYSHYDGTTVFAFQPQVDPEPLHWWWRDDDPDSLCASRFTPTA
jgi:hypothetical protein